jgi:hypothetical protein
VKEKGLKLPSKRVVVIGGGIAGLTAAQELAERGYEVQVVEKESDQYDETQPRLGGLARTAWARVPQPSQDAPILASSAPPTKPEKPARGQEATPAPPGEWAGKALALDSVPTPVQLLFGSAGPADGTAVKDAKDVVAFCKDPGHAATLSLIVVKAQIDVKALKPLDALGTNACAVAMRKWIADNVGPEPYSLSVLSVPGTADDGRMQVGVQSARVPGEHGFRFFPSFYRHMFDTMQRIPIPEVSTDTPIVYGTVPQADSSRSALDNVVSGTSLELAFAPEPATKKRGPRPRDFSVPRTAPLSAEAARRLQANLLEKAGYRALDVVRLTTKYLEYMTSSPERRRQQYEKQSWADFLGLSGGGYSPYFASQVDGGAQALVAMSTRTNDARTIGTPSMQLVLDELRSGPRTDGILNGPTTTALFAPWQDYLQSLGVRFTRGTLYGFEGVGMAVRPKFQLPAGADEVDPADYYVIAIPVVDFQAMFEGGPFGGLLTKDQLLEANRECLTLEEMPPDMDEGEDPDDLHKYLEFPVDGYASHPDRGPFRYMCGIQFFFRREVSLIGGHAICPDSPWGVCYLSQVQYWQDRQRGDDGVRGVVSATFTEFEVAAMGRDGTSKAAIDCSAAEIAERVWLQIEQGWDTAKRGPLPEPEYFFLDENLSRDDAGAWKNKTPYLVNDLETWPRRGGVRTRDDDYRYVLQLGHTVFAGVFMRTWTRMNTMEAANETGRRAVNAILAQDAVKTTECPLWNMEDDEVPELLALRDLDRRVLARGGKHPMRSSAFEALLRATPWDLVRLGFPASPDVPTD